MKKALVSILSAGCLLLAFTLTACSNQGGGNPEEPPTSGLTYEKRGDAYAVTGMTGAETAVVIPAEYEGLPVTTIAESAFAYSRHTEDILSVTIPDSVTTIERNAFYNRDETTTVNISENSKLETIGNNAFSGNGALTGIYIPSTVTDIGESAFNNDGAVNFTVAQSNAVYRSENGHLIERASDTLVRGGQSGVVPDGIKAIAQAAFRQSKTVTKLVIPASVTAIGNYVIADSSIATVRFKGTESEWNAIEKTTSWNSFNRDVKLIYKSEPDILIAYFSWSGTTTRLAEHVSAVLPQATTYRIERETPYSDNYNEVAYGEAKEEADSNARPPVKDPLSAQTVSGYDAIIIMYPIWWHTAPMVVGTFLETYDLSGVDIYPITQSASMSTSQFNQSYQFIKECAGNATVHDGLGTKSTDAIDNYLRANGLLA